MKVHGKPSKSHLDSSLKGAIFMVVPVWVNFSLNHEQFVTSATASTSRAESSRVEILLNNTLISNKTLKYST